MEHGGISVESAAVSGEKPRLELAVLEDVPEISAEETAAAAHKGSVMREKARLKARKDAEEELAAEEAAASYKPLAPVGISSFLSKEPPGEKYHVEGLWPAGGLALMVAHAKWGKSTFARHLIETAILGGDVLGQFAVAEGGAFDRGLLIDLELTEWQLWDYWNGTSLTDAQLVFDRLRGRTSTVAIRDARVRKELAARIRDSGAEFVAWDPFGPILAVNGWDENSATDVRSAIQYVKEIHAEAGDLPGVLFHHTGWDGKRLRGSSTFKDEVDAVWTGESADSEDPFSKRYLKGVGRGVAFPKSEVERAGDGTLVIPSLGGCEAAAGLSKEEKNFAKDQILAGKVRAKLDAGLVFASVRELTRELGLPDSGTVRDDLKRLHGTLVDIGYLEPRPNGPRGEMHWQKA